MNDTHKDTVQDYLVALTHQMTMLDDGPEFNQLQEYFNDTCEMLDFLYTCYQLPPYEAVKSN